VSSISPKGEAGSTKGSGGIILTWLPRLAWGGAILMVALAVYIFYERPPAVFSAYFPENQASAPAPVQAAGQPAPEKVALPDFEAVVPVSAVPRTTTLHTLIPDRPRSTADSYTVEKGDSLFGIAKFYGLKPATVLWANYDTLNDNPNDLSIGDNLRIPPTDGIFYKWKEGDKLEKVAETYKADVKDILTWPGNKLDLLNPQIKAGTYIMIPGGWRPTNAWLIPNMWRANSGASRGITAGCATTGTAVGGGYFVWPADNHYLSGNEYSEVHLGIDIAAGEGAAVYAADTGVVVYAAPIAGGYGNMIMIDHGNGFSTVYGHLSSFLVRCGQNVSRGQQIAKAGSTGNSTGPHLHFEVRQNGAFINPWYVLP
jgi:murein DD-endopeptidase MepM/ murein hydrolase activator NlpD